MTNPYENSNCNRDRKDDENIINFLFTLSIVVMLGIIVLSYIDNKTNDPELSTAITLFIMNIPIIIRIYLMYDDRALFKVSSLIIPGDKKQGELSG